MSTLDGKHGLLLISGSLAKSLMRSIPLPSFRLIIITFRMQVRKYRSCQIGNDNTIIDQLQSITDNNYFFHIIWGYLIVFYCALTMLLYNMLCVISRSISSCFYILTIWLQFTRKLQIPRFCVFFKVNLRRSQIFIFKSFWDVGKPYLLLYLWFFLNKLKIGIPEVTML